MEWEACHASVARGEVLASCHVDWAFEKHVFDCLRRIPGACHEFFGE